MNTKSTIAIILALLLAFTGSALAQQTLANYAKGARSINADLADALDTLDKTPATLTAGQVTLIRNQIAAYRARHLEGDAKFLEGKLGTSSGSSSATITPPTAPVQVELPSVAEPQEVAHTNLESGYEKEDPAFFNARNVFLVQQKQWGNMAAKTTDLVRQRAYTKYAAAYAAALTVFDGGSVTPADQDAYGPALDQFEKRTRAKGHTLNADEINKVIAKGGFKRTVEMASLAGGTGSGVVSTPPPSTPPAPPSPPVTPPSTPPAPPASGSSTASTPPANPGAVPPGYVLPPPTPKRALVKTGTLTPPN